MKSFFWAFSLICICVIAFIGCKHFQNLPDLFPTGTPTPAPTATAAPLKPTDTPVPATFTPTPKPEPTTNQFSMRVRVTDIPVMTDANKDQLNKQVFFCLTSGNDMLGVYHRYYQPAWPNGEWWVTWRLEYFRNGQQIAEIAHADMMHLPGREATFCFDWSHIENLTVTCEETGEKETLCIDNHPRDWIMTENCLDHFPSGSVALRL